MSWHVGERPDRWTKPSPHDKDKAFRIKYVVARGGTEFPIKYVAACGELPHRWTRSSPRDKAKAETEQHRAQIDRKSNGNRPEIDQTSTENRAKSLPGAHGPIWDDSGSVGASPGVFGGRRGAAGTPRETPGE